MNKIYLLNLSFFCQPVMFFFLTDIVNYAIIDLPSNQVSWIITLNYNIYEYNDDLIMPWSINHLEVLFKFLVYWLKEMLDHHGNYSILLLFSLFSRYAHTSSHPGFYQWFGQEYPKGNKILASLHPCCYSLVGSCSYYCL